MSGEQGESRPARLLCEVSGEDLRCEATGLWSATGGGAQGPRREWRRALKERVSLERVSFSMKADATWDSTLPSFLEGCLKDCRERKLEPDLSALPAGLRKLLRLAEARPEANPDEEGSRGILEFIGSGVLGGAEATGATLAFLGEWTLAMGRTFSFRAKWRARDFLAACRACGASALPIVSLVSFLSGLTLAFVGSVQLDKFNARIYVADLVSLAMVREMGALMVAIVMAGRTGAAFAAELGNMKLNEEIDSLRTFGLSPMEFLVLPRVLALFVMTPLLTLYADVVGILGGLFVGVAVMDFSLHHYLQQTQVALDAMWEVWSGLYKSLAFGWIIGMVGCCKGLRCGSDSAALGRAVTNSVVLSITLVVVADAVFEVFYSVMNLR